MLRYTLAALIALLCCSCGEDGKQDQPPVKRKLTRTTAPTYLNCPTGTHLTYENFGEAFMLNYCTGCHSQNLAAEQRAGAPVRVNLDTIADIARWRMMIRVVASDSRTARMPPKMKISNEERKTLREWLDCGAPGDQESLTPVEN